VWVAISPVKNLPASKLGALVHEVVMTLFEYAGLTVVALNCDGASTNRSKQRTLVAPLAFAQTVPRFEFVSAFCKCPGGREIAILSDISHLIKKALTHLKKSSEVAGASRLRTMPDYLAQTILHRFPSSGRVSEREVGDTVGLEAYMRVFARLYELLADRRQPADHTYDPAKDARLTELRAIVKWAMAWKAWAEEADFGAPRNATERSRLFLSWQLAYDLKTLIHGALKVLKDTDTFVGAGGKFIVRFSDITQDSLESLFGCVRGAFGGGCDPTFAQVLSVVPRVEDKLNSMCGVTNILHRRKLLKRNTGDTTVPELEIDGEDTVAKVHSDSSDSGSSDDDEEAPASLPAAPLIDIDQGPVWLQGHRIVLPNGFDKRCEEEILRIFGRRAFQVATWAMFKKRQDSDELLQLSGCRKEAAHIKKEDMIRTGFSRMKVGPAVRILSMRTANSLRTKHHQAARLSEAPTLPTVEPTGPVGGEVDAQMRSA
jgi:hypothetical protein